MTDRTYTHAELQAAVALALREAIKRIANPTIVALFPHPEGSMNMAVDVEHAQEAISILITSDQQQALRDHKRAAIQAFVATELTKGHPEMCLCQDCCKAVRVREMANEKAAS